MDVACPHERADHAVADRVDQRRAGHEVVEEAHLRLHVAPERAVVLPMLERDEVGEDAELVGQSVDPPLYEGVAGHLHRGEVGGGGGEAGQRAMEREWRGRGEPARLDLRAEADPEGADRADAQARRVQHGLEHRERGGLAERTGDADQRDSVRGPVVPRRRQLRERGAAVLDDERGNGNVPIRRPLRHDRGRAPLDRVPDVRVAIRRSAGDGHEHATRPQCSGVRRDAGDPRVAGVPDGRQPRQRRRQLEEPPRSLSAHAHLPPLPPQVPFTPAGPPGCGVEIAPWRER